jgi:hypothetical protein
VGLFPYIRIPTLKIFAPIQARNIVNNILNIIERATWEKGGTVILMRINMRVGVNSGNIDVIITNGVLALCVTTTPMINGMNSR